MERLNPSAFVLVHLSCKLWPVQNGDIHQQEREQDSLYLEFPDPSSLRGPDLPPFISILFISLPSHPVLLFLHPHSPLSSSHVVLFLCS